MRAQQPELLGGGDGPRPGIFRENRNHIQGYFLEISLLSAGH